jgi:hypothetical protein
VAPRPGGNFVAPGKNKFEAEITFLHAAITFFHAGIPFFHAAITLSHAAAPFFLNAAETF